MAYPKKVLKRIEQAAMQGQTKLDLSGNQLISLPPEITRLTNLTTLHLSRNQLTSLPPEILRLTNLTRLYLDRNQLASVPPWFAITL